MELLWIGVLGVLFVLVTFYCMRQEGFVSGRAPLDSSSTVSMPAPAEESMISHDLPGAVTPAPDQSLASTQDLIALQDALRFFHDAVAAQHTVHDGTSSSKSFQGTAETIGSFAQLKKELPAQEARVGAALTDLSKNDYTVEEATRLRTFYELGADKILTITEGFENPSYNIAGPHITADDLQELIKRIQSTRQDLVNQRSLAPTIRARIDQLEKLTADLRELREKLVRKQIDPRDVPIEVEAARTFLTGLNASDVPPLITPGGGAAETAAVPESVPTDVPIHPLLDQVKQLRWTMEVTVGSPEERLLERLDAIEARLNHLSTSPHAAAAEYAPLHDEIQSIQSRVGVPDDRSVPAHHRPRRPHSTRLPDLSSQPRSPTHANLSCAQSSTFADPAASLPPGDETRYGMTDEQIRHRASSGTPSYDGVGGPDYKARSADLCRSIAASGLGDPANFGCLANPNAVSSTYSWKGAHAMICNRLGDTWGSAYPEQFGCGKYDPTARFVSEIL